MPDCRLKGYLRILHHMLGSSFRLAASLQSVGDSRHRLVRGTGRRTCFACPGSSCHKGVKGGINSKLCSWREKSSLALQVVSPSHCPDMHIGQVIRLVNAPYYHHLCCFGARQHGCGMRKSRGRCRVSRCLDRSQLCSQAMRSCTQPGPPSMSTWWAGANLAAQNHALEPPPESKRNTRGPCQPVSPAACLPAPSWAHLSCAAAAGR